MNLDSDPKNPRVRSPALHVVCVDGRKSLGNSDHHLKESTILEAVFGAILAMRLKFLSVMQPNVHQG